jgi:gamma-glutamyltranspeptidase/glutathione hydrolase
MAMGRGTSGLDQGGRGAVAAGHPVTAAAAAEMLAAGGNAFDAAVAGVAAACVAEPVLASLGGGGFLTAMAVDGAPQVYDFFVQTPKRKRPAAVLDFAPIACDFGPAVQTFHAGMGAAATPGIPAGLFAVQRDLGSLPMRDLLAPAIRAARDGVAWRPFEGYAFGIVEGIWRYTPGTAALIDGFSETEPLRQPALADTLDGLAREGEALFYRGEIGARLALLARECGGHLTMDDLRGYAVQRQPALAASFARARIWTAPPPSSGGLLIAFALGLLEALGDTADTAVLLAQVMAATNKARIDSGLALAENEVEETRAMGQLLSPETVMRYRKAILNRSATARGTTHLSIVDSKGNLAAVTLSNGEGCGYMIPGTGIHINNMLGEEDLNPRGFHRWTPDSRMISMMSPTVALLDGDRRIALGSGGSNRLRTAILQVLRNRLTRGCTLAEAVAAPRLHVEGTRLSHEPEAVSERQITDLAAQFELEPWPEANMFFGGVHAVEYKSGGPFQAAADARRAGVSLIL